MICTIFVFIISLLECHFSHTRLHLHWIPKRGSTLVYVRLNESVLFVFASHPPVGWAGMEDRWTGRAACVPRPGVWMSFFLNCTICESMNPKAFQMHTKPSNIIVISNSSRQNIEKVVIVICILYTLCSTRSRKYSRKKSERAIYRQVEYPKKKKDKTPILARLLPSWSAN